MRPPNHHRCLRQLVTWDVRLGHGGNSLPLCRFFKPPSLPSPIWVSPSHTRARFSGQLLVELMGFYRVSTVVSKCLAGSNLRTCMLGGFVRRSIEGCTVSSSSLPAFHKSVEPRGFGLLAQQS